MAETFPLDRLVTEVLAHLGEANTEFVRNKCRDAIVDWCYDTAMLRIFTTADVRGEEGDNPRTYNIIHTGYRIVQIIRAWDSERRPENLLDADNYAQTLLGSDESIIYASIRQPETILIEAALAPNRDDNMVSLPAEVYQRYKEALVDKALSQLHKDPRMMTMRMQMYDRWVSRARMELDSGTPGRVGIFIGNTASRRGGSGLTA